MCACARLLLLSALPALAGLGGWCAEGEVVSLAAGGAGAGAGAGPAFAPRQPTAVVAPLGHTATLDCRVLRLGDKSVSWVRSRDLQILSHAGTVFTADARVSAATRADTDAPAAVAGAGAAVTSRHALRIDRLRRSDAGRYECQVNTEPKLSLFFNLTVVDEVVPRVVVTALEAPVVHGIAGGAATLTCEARYSPAPRQLPLPPLDVHWHRADQPVTLQVGTEGGRGGVSLDTERWPARVVSRLTLADLAAPDAGSYTCAAAGETVTLRLRVLDTQENPEAMQRDEAAGGAGGTLRPTLPWLLLCSALWRTLLRASLVFP